MDGIASSALAIAMIAVFLLSFGGIKLMVGKDNRKQGGLMLVAALVLLVNVLIWTV